MRRGSLNFLKQRNKFKNAFRKPRFIKQYVMGLQQPKQKRGTLSDVVSCVQGIWILIIEDMCLKVS